MNSAQLFVRAFHIQQDKLDCCLDYNEQMSRLFVDFIDVIPEEVKAGYLKLTKKFIDRYNTLLGKEGIDEQEEN